MSSLQIQQVLAEMRALQSRVSGVSDALGSPPGVSGATPGTGVQPVDFASLMKNTVDNVATMQNNPAGIAVDAHFLYWTDAGGGTIMKTAKN